MGNVLGSPSAFLPNLHELLCEFEADQLNPENIRNRAKSRPLHIG